MCSARQSKEIVSTERKFLQIFYYFKIYPHFTCLQVILHKIRMCLKIFAQAELWFSQMSQDWSKSVFYSVHYITLHNSKAQTGASCQTRHKNNTGRIHYKNHEVQTSQSLPNFPLIFFSGRAINRFISENNRRCRESCNHDTGEGSRPGSLNTR